MAKKVYRNRYRSASAKPNGEGSLTMENGRTYYFSEWAYLSPEQLSDYEAKNWDNK